MTKVFNPLLDKRKGKSTEMTASDKSDNVMEGDGPISPVSNRRMERALCGTVPVWIDAQARLILPIKKGM
jgi:hypothetical protein